MVPRFRGWNILVDCLLKTGLKLFHVMTEVLTKRSLITYFVCIFCERGLAIKPNALFTKLGNQTRRSILFHCLYYLVPIVN